MRIKPIDTRTTFGYSHPLKTLYKKGKLPTVQYGIYGDKLTKDNVSLEHLLPHSKGGRTVLDNLVLASKKNNQSRGNKPIKDFLTKENFERYVNQFLGVKVGNFNGTDYIRRILKTLNRLLDE